jgi:hypothetical protein
VVKSTIGREGGEARCTCIITAQVTLAKRKSRARLHAAKGTETMVQTALSSHQIHTNPSSKIYHYSAMEVPQPIQLLEDDKDDLEEEAFDEYEEDEDDIDDSVAEDMKKLEESFKGISQKYRLINRIGEGSFGPETEAPTQKLTKFRHLFYSLQGRAAASGRRGELRRGRSS